MLLYTPMRVGRELQHIGNEVVQFGLFPHQGECKTIRLKREEKVILKSSLKRDNIVVL
jgi:hypothetical protein